MTPSAPESSSLGSAIGLACALGAQTLFLWLRIRLSTKSTVEKSEKSTNTKIEQTAADLNTVIAAQTEVIESQSKLIRGLQFEVEESRKFQINLSGKHTETMNEVYKALRTIELKKSGRPGVEETSGNVTTVEDPEPSFGKIVRKD